MTEPIAFSKYIELVRQEARDNPDNQVSCIYINYGYADDDLQLGDPIITDAVCIHGHALAKVTDLQTMGKCLVAQSLTSDAIGSFKDEEWLALGVKPPTRNQKRWVDEVQTRQDSRPKSYVPHAKLDVPDHDYGTIRHIEPENDNELYAWGNAVDITDQIFKDLQVSLRNR